MGWGLGCSSTVVACQAGLLVAAMDLGGENLQSALACEKLAC